MRDWHPGRVVPGTQNWRLVIETRIYWRQDADVVVLSRLENNNWLYLESGGNWFWRLSERVEFCGGQAVACPRLVVQRLS